MKSHISKVRIAALAVGLAIVMSSCGIQNQAGDSSSASGKTKNFALLADGQFCYDSPDEQQQAVQAFDEVDAAWHRNNFDADNNGVVDFADHEAVYKPVIMALNAQIGGCPAPAPTASGGDEAAAEAALYSCVKPEEKQRMIDGYKEQIAKTEYPADWSTAAIADYQDQMKRGLATAELICTN